MDLKDAAKEIAHRLDDEFDTRIISVDGGCEVLVAGEVNGEIFVRPDNSESGFTVDLLFANGGVEIIRSRLSSEEMSPYIGGEWEE